MAELTFTAFQSLDGVMQAPGAPDEDLDGDFPHGGWVVPFVDDDMLKIVLNIFARADAFLLGRRTYDIFAAWWPHVTDSNDLIASKLNGLPKHVASRSTASFTWQHSSALPEVGSGVAALKQRYDRELQVHGSIDLAQTLMANDLIDEYRLLTFPVVVGTGKRLFGRGAMPATLALQSCSTTGAGIVYSVYRRGGPLKTGTFTLE